MKDTIKAAVLKKWTTDWKYESKGRHLYDIKPIPNRWKHACRPNRYDEIRLARLRSGHAMLNAYWYKYCGGDSPTCDKCYQADCTTQHVLLECSAFDYARHIMLSAIRAELKCSIDDITVKVLLGGGDFSDEKNDRIMDIVIGFVKKCNIIV